MNDLSSTNFWLAMVAIASLGQFLMALTMTVCLFVAWKRLSRAADILEQEHLMPLAAKARGVMDDLHDVSERARALDDAVRDRMDGVESALRTTKTVVVDRLWPLFGTARAVQAGLSAWSASGRRRRLNPERPR